MREKLKSYYKIYESDDTRKIFENNEYESNKLSAIITFICALVLLTAWILNLCGVFTVSERVMNALAAQGLVELFIPIVLYFVFKGRKSWLKYVLVIALLLVCTRLFAVLNHNVLLIMILPVLLSSRYFYKAFTMLISLLTIIMMAAASASTAFFGILDLNFAPSPADGTSLAIDGGLRASLIENGVDTGAVAARMMLHGFVPRLLVFMVIAAIAVLIAQHGHKMVLEQAEISEVSAGVKSELNTATQIQNSMVPNIFPPFPDRQEFDIYASMNTAKEVGGDFYDFFLIDDNHLGLVIADVSGKGIPAALFMMATKILINDRTTMGGTPAEILSFVNERICRNNIAEMFVTVWLGILDITSGKVIAANAGHEYPVLCKEGGKFEQLKDNHSFVVGGMKGVRYKNYEFTLSKGDAIFVYTDGVTEAINDKEELFGNSRMIEALNLKPDGTPDEIIGNVKKSVDKYVGDAERFDDITMLCLRYNGGLKE